MKDNGCYNRFDLTMNVSTAEPQNVENQIKLLVRKAEPPIQLALKL